MSKAWERQEDESSQAFEAFSLYLGMGADRSCAKVARQLSKSKTIITRWSSDWKWQDRIREYDNWLVGEEDKRVSSDIRQRYGRFSQISDLAIQKASEALMARDSDALTNGDIRGLIQIAMQLADKHREFFAPPKEDETVGDIQAAFINAIMGEEVDYDRLG